jgi:DNA-binding NarL/FixJ family response regulator
MQIRLLVTGWDAEWVAAMRARAAAWVGDPTIVCVQDPSADVLLLQGDDVDLAISHLTHVFSLGGPLTTRVLLARRSCTAEEITRLVRHGVNGCVDPSRDDLLPRGVRGVAAGEDWFPRGALLKALRLVFAIQPIEVRSAEPQLTHLTHREGEILQLIGQGLTNKEIGRRLEISDQTVKTHLHRVYAKLHQSGRYKAFLANPGEAIHKGLPIDEHAGVTSASA